MFSTISRLYFEQAEDISDEAVLRKAAEEAKRKRSGSHFPTVPRRFGASRSKRSVSLFRVDLDGVRDT